MARYVQYPCQSSKCGGELKTQMVIGYGQETEMQIIQCDICGGVSHKNVAKVPKRKTTYPYYHEGCGVRFESESHEQKFAKANKLEKV